MAPALVGQSKGGVYNDHVQDVTQAGTSNGTSQVPPAGYSVAEAAALLGVSANTVRARCKAGQLRSERIWRPQGEVIRVYLDVQDLQDVQAPGPPAPGAGHLQPGTSTGTSSHLQHVQTEIQRAETMAGFLVPLLEQAMRPLVAELAGTRAQLVDQAQTIGRLEEQVRALQEHHEPQTVQDAPQGDSDAPRPTEASMPPPPRRRPWWMFWRA